jgi:hypothetical protein
MDAVTSENAVKQLLERVPAFAAARANTPWYVSHDDDSSPYLVFGDFGRFLSDLILSGIESGEGRAVIEESFALLNEMGSSSNDQLANIAQVGTFELLTDHPETIAAARAHLSGIALALFERTVDIWVPGA